MRTAKYNFYLDQKPFQLLSTKLLQPGEKIIYTQLTDLNQQKKFYPNYLIITDMRLLVIDSEKLISEILLSKIKKLKVEELFNHTRLSALTSHQTDTILYYTKNLAPQFGTIVRLTNLYLLTKQTTILIPDRIHHSHCTRCGNPLPERGSNCPICLPKITILARLFSLLKPYRFQTLYLLVITGIMVAAQTVPPYITKKIVDDVIKNGQINDLNFWIIMMLAVNIIYFVSSYFSGIQTTWLATRVIADLREQVYSKILRIKLTFFNRFPSGELVSKTLSDTNEIEHFLMDGLSYLVINIFSVILIAGILLYIDYKLTLLILLPVPFLIFGSKWFLEKLIPLFHYRGSVRDQVMTILGESIEGIRIVKAFTQQPRHEKEFQTSSNQLFTSNYRIDQYWIGFRQIMYVIMQIGIIGVWLFATKRIIFSQDLTLGDLLAFVGYIWLFYGPLQWFTQILNWLTHALAAAERIFLILDLPEEEIKPTSVKPKPISGHITFQNIRFSYEQGKEVIKGLSFNIKPGEMIGLVGKSGAGKSTIINLINRFYDPDSGRILIDDKNIKNYPLDFLRRNIGLVLQEPFLFNGSILDNIRYGNYQAKFADILAAARAARAHEFIIQKENGYNTIIGERGLKLSGGEKQRLSIARAILQNPPILILDEATSSVDVETEKKIQDALDILINNRTTIAIAHRLSTLRNAHRLVFIEDGKIIETGTHDYLMKKNGKYAKLVAIQSRLTRIKGEILHE